MLVLTSLCLFGSQKHRSVKILQFLKREKIQKSLTQLQNILAFLTIRHLQAKPLI